MKSAKGSHRLTSVSLVLGGILLCLGVFGYVLPRAFSVSYSTIAGTLGSVPAVPPLDKTAYDIKLLELAHVATTSPWYFSFLAGTTTPLTPEGAATTTSMRRPLWPVRAAYPKDSRALLPFNRIVAYYGNFYSTQMGVLGQYPEDEVLSRLQNQINAWEEADPATPVIPAIEYIDVTAQGSAGKDGKYRARMPDSQIDKALEMADKVHGIVILDIQVGLSTLPDELPLLRDYLKKPNVHLAIDPEFAMHDGVRPGRVIGTMSSADINYASKFLADLVDEYDLPPKILVVHRFTEEMVTGYKNIETRPEVQVVMQMDGWGSPARKVGTYNHVIYPEPVQFTGFKLFYKNDLKEDPPRLMTPGEVLSLTPAPVFIQYQ